MHNLREIIPPLLEKGLLVTGAAVSITMTAYHPRFAFAQETPVIPPDIVIHPSPPPPPPSYYEGNTHILTIGGRNQLRITQFCGGERNNPTNRQYAEAKFVSRNLEPGEKVVGEIWTPYRPTEPIIREINGEVGISENFTVDELPLGENYHFYLRDRGQIFDAGPRDFICTPDVLYPD